MSRSWSLLLKVKNSYMNQCKNSVGDWKSRIVKCHCWHNATSTWNNHVKKLRASTHKYLRVSVNTLPLNPGRWLYITIEDKAIFDSISRRGWSNSLATAPGLAVAVYCLGHSRLEEVYILTLVGKYPCSWRSAVFYELNMAQEAI